MGWAILSIALMGALVLLLVSAGIEDARRREIANWKNAAIALLAPVFWWTSGLDPWPGMVIQLGVATAVFAVFCVAFHFGQMGGGDVKMIGAVALWFPFPALVALLIAMSLAGGVITLLMIVDRKIARRTGLIEIPYGVAIAAAALLSLREPLLNHF